MKKILFLTRSYPDTRKSASLLCTKRVIDCVAASGKYDVHVLCLRYKGELYNENVYGVKVHRFKPTLWLSYRQRVKAANNIRMDRILEVVQKTLTIPTFPQTEALTTRLFYKAAKKLHRSEGFSAVISEHHGLESLLTGCRLMHDFGIKHVAIFWDPLKGQIATSHLPISYTDNRLSRLEKFVANNTTLQISTVSMKNFHQQVGDVAKDHRVYLDIPSVLKPEPEVPTKHLELLRDDCINVVASGLLSTKYRDPIPIIQLFNKCERADKLNLVFFSMGANDALQEVSKTFNGNIVCHDYIPLDELHSIYRHADYLLNVSHVNANMVPSKIFEYMSFGKPIISTFITDGDAAQKYVTRYPEGLCVDLKNDDATNVESINVFLKKRHKDVSFDIVSDLFKDNTPEKYLATIDIII